MNDELTRDLLHALFCFRQATGLVSRSLSEAGGGAPSVAELAALGCINRCDTAQCSEAKQTAHQSMHETMTKKGKSAIEKGQKRMDELFSRIIEQFSEKDTRQFVRLLNRFAEVVDETVK